MRTLLNAAFRSRAHQASHWLAQTPRQLFWVPRQTPAAQVQRPAGIFGVLVSPY